MNTQWTKGPLQHTVLGKWDSNMNKKKKKKEKRRRRRREGEEEEDYIKIKTFCMPKKTTNKLKDNVLNGTIRSLQMT